MKHKHYDMIVQTMAELGEWERRGRIGPGYEWSDWAVVDRGDFRWSDVAEYEIRRIVKPLYQARVEIPRPETEEPERGKHYYVADLYSAEIDKEGGWGGNAWELRWLSRGLVYLRKEDAEARVAAMLRTEE